MSLRKVEVVSRWIQIAILAALFVGLLIAGISALGGEEGSVKMFILYHLLAGVITAILSGRRFFQKSDMNKLVKFLVIGVMGFLSPVIAIVVVLKEVAYLNSFGDDFMTNFADTISMKSGKQYKVIARIFCNSHFYAITQPIPMPRDFKSNGVIIHRMKPNKKQDTTTYTTVGDKEFNIVRKRYDQLRKKGKIKINALQHSFRDMTATELHEFIRQNGYKIRNYTALNDGDADTLRAIITGYEHKQRFISPNDNHKWTNAELREIARLYIWQLEWLKEGFDANYVVSQGERLEVNKFYRLCKALENVYDQQQAKTKGPLSRQEFDTMIQNA